MELFERVRKVASEIAGSQSELARVLGMSQRTFSGYLKKERQDNLWPLLPRIWLKYPSIRREWLWWDEGPMLGGNHAETPEPHEMTDSDNTNGTAVGPEWSRSKLVNDLGYYDDALGRIFKLTGIRTTSALELQSVFGVDFKELKGFVSRYVQARERLRAWKEAGSPEEERSGAPEPIPEEWLCYFWTHFGPNPGWIQYGERSGSRAPLLRPNPLSSMMERLSGENEGLREALSSASRENKAQDKRASAPIHARGEKREQQ